MEVDLLDLRSPVVFEISAGLQYRNPITDRWRGVMVGETCHLQDDGWNGSTSLNEFHQAAL